MVSPLEHSHVYPVYEQTAVPADVGSLSTKVAGSSPSGDHSCWHCSSCTAENVRDSFACTVCGFHDWTKSYIHPLYIPPYIRGMRDIGEESFLLNDPDPWVTAQFLEFQQHLDQWPVAQKTWLSDLLHISGFTEDVSKIRFSITGFKMLWDKDRFDLFDQLPGDPFLAYHGTTKDSFSNIFMQNIDPTLRKLDDGWYGNGAYFTTNMIYAAHYIRFRGLGSTTSFKLPKPGNAVYILGVLLKPGRTFQVTDMSLRGMPCKPKYDSHKVFVAPAGKVRKEFLPVDKSQAIADEWVMFEQWRICPRFVIEVLRER